MYKQKITEISELAAQYAEGELSKYLHTAYISHLQRRLSENIERCLTEYIEQRDITLPLCGRSDVISDACVGNDIDPRHILDLILFIKTQHPDTFIIRNNDEIISDVVNFIFNNLKHIH